MKGREFKKKKPGELVFGVGRCLLAFVLKNLSGPWLRIVHLIAILKSANENLFYSLLLWSGRSIVEEETNAQVCLDCQSRRGGRGTEGLGQRLVWDSKDFRRKQLKSIASAEPGIEHRTEL